MIRLTILGTGAMACLAGARLAPLDVSVTIAGSWPEGIAAINAGGVRLTEADGAESVVPVRAVDRRDLTGGADLVLVLVKSYQTAEVAPAAARASHPGGVVLTLQNGLGHREILAEHVPTARLAAGATSVGASLLGPGWVRAGGPGDTVIGPDSAGAGPDAASLDSIAALLTDAGFNARTAGNVDPWLWGKLVVNAAINPLSAILGAPNGALLAPPARAVLVAAAREAAAVAVAEGVVLPFDPVAQALSVAERTAANRSSMLQDVERGAPTEIDAISGEVLRRGLARGVPTPVTAWLAAQVDRICAGQPAAPLATAPL